MAFEGIFLFPPFRLDAANQRLWRESKLLALRPKTFEVLFYLVQNAQRLVTKQELLDQVWTDTVVSDELLRGYIRELRDTLADNAKKPRYIETVPARGYRFLLRVELEAPSSVHGVQTKPAVLRPLQDSYLVAKGQNLNLQRGASAKPGADTNDQGKESSQHGGTLAQPSLSSTISV
jgi:DNA-binding winged helix-turn-helix (wHTH) protein